MTTIVVANQKGGVGKTTVACLLAWWLAENGYARVALLDLDAQANASRTIAAGRHTVAPFTASALFGDAAPSLEDPHPGVTLIAAGPKLADVDTDPAAPGRFQRNVECLKGFDAVVIDTPPALGRRMLAALVAADRVLCPIELEDYSIDGLASMLRTVQGVRSRWNARLDLLGILANRFNHHSASQRQALEVLLTRYSDMVIPGKLSLRSSIPLAASQGLPVWRLSKSAARDAAAEVRHVMTMIGRKLPAADTSTSASHA